MKTPDSTIIRAAFISYVQSQGKRPSTLREFCRENDFDRHSVKAHYTTLAALEKDVWVHWFEETITVLYNSDEYGEYSAREKLLSFYYTWIETLRPYKQYVVIAPVVPALYSNVDWFLWNFQQVFLRYARKIIQLAAVNHEIVRRPLLLGIYNRALWQQLLFIMTFWAKDESEGQTKTDEAIERSVHLFFELAGHTQLDALVDFGKFLFRSKE